MTPGTALALVSKPRNALTARNGRQPSGKRKTRKRGAPPPKKLSRLRQPDDMTLESWQVALRRQFARKQKFRLKNVGKRPIFSDFEVTNPQTKRTYRVAIRGRNLGDNYCSCPDFAVNTLGTCKHIEFTLHRLAKAPGAKKAFAAGFQPAHSEVYVRYGAKREVCFRPGKNCPEGLQRFARGFFDAQGQLKPEAYARFQTFLPKATDFGHELICYDDALALVAQVRDKQTLRRRVDEAFPQGARSAAFARLVKAKLYPYQREGALFLARAGRCLLADDMGLGKTIQALAAAEILARTVGVERVLIIAPTSLKHQWKREIEKFTDRTATVVEGLLARRSELYAADSFYKITNYDVVHRDLERIRAWQPELIILDEAQRIKNWKTRTAQCVKRLESPYTFVLTGTPLENRLEELHSIVEFVDRFRLGPMFRFLREHQHADEHGRVIGYHNLSGISKTLEPMLLRRTKAKVLKDLPERLEKRLFVPMTPEQSKHHEENREGVARIVAKWRRFGFLAEADQRRLMILLQNMRMSCNSTYLLDQKTDFGVKADEIIELLSEMLEDAQTKVVIFSQWVRMHELVVNRIKQKHWQHVLFYGGVPGPKRKHLVQRFKDDPDCRLFLATDAGGVGLNLQNASAVVNLDLPWNPAVLEQRIGRVHRLGQRRPVRVVHLISQGTIEEGMLGILGFKSAMLAGVLDGGQDEVFLGGTRLKRFMESVETVTSSIPSAMPYEKPMAEGDESEAEREAAAAASPVIVPEDVTRHTWDDVLAAGTALLEKLSQAFGAGGAPGRVASGMAQSGPASLATSLVAQDQQTGQPYLKLPLPSPDTVERIVNLLGTILKR